MKEIIDYASLVLATEDGRIALEVDERAKKPYSELRSRRSKLKTLSRRAESGREKLQTSLREALAIVDADPVATEYAALMMKLASTPFADAETTSISDAGPGPKRTKSSASSSKSVVAQRKAAPSPRKKAGQAQ